MVNRTRSPIPKCNDYRKKRGGWANYDVYRYNELVAIQRKNEDGVYHDTILNLIEIETAISSFLAEHEKEHQK